MGYRKSPKTEGGMQLRALREHYGKTQIQLEMAANLGIGYLQRLELGKVQRPDPETLERIVEALGASFVERNAVFSRFGYILPIKKPNESETQWAIKLFHSQNRQKAMPAYLLDCSHRLLAWNDLTQRLFKSLEHDYFQNMPAHVSSPCRVLSHRTSGAPTQA